MERDHERSTAVCWSTVTLINDSCIPYDHIFCNVTDSDGNRWNRKGQQQRSESRMGLITMLMQTMVRVSDREYRCLVSTRKRQPCTGNSECSRLCK